MIMKGIDVTNDITTAIRLLVNDVSVVLSQIPPSVAAAKPDPSAWSKQEILGHLIDSVTNNHQRIVRAATNPGTVTYHMYNQEDWVRIQDYNACDWDNLIQFWSAYNHHLCTVIDHLPEAVLSAPCDIGKAEPVTLEFIIRDYLRHLRHHVTELIGAES